jgi:predicted flap endonuclease-1-like 5' DNA nuclease
MEWLAGHMWLLLLLAAILGLIIGCWICGRREKEDTTDLDAELARLRSRCEECDAQKAKLRSQVLELETELKNIHQAPAPASAPVSVPTFYDSPTDGDPDDLKKIKGVGPKLETLLHSLGVYYFRQIAGWSDAQVAEVDPKLTFKGRIERDDWRGQAKTLADGGETEFGSRYDKGDT